MSENAKPPEYAKWWRQTIDILEIKAELDRVRSERDQLVALIVGKAEDWCGLNEADALQGCLQWMRDPDPIPDVVAKALADHDGRAGRAEGD
jgi:hypothetical protein